MVAHNYRSRRLVLPCHNICSIILLYCYNYSYVVSNAMTLPPVNNWFCHSAKRLVLSECGCQVECPIRRTIVVPCWICIIRFALSNHVSAVSSGLVKEERLKCKLFEVLEKRVKSLSSLWDHTCVLLLFTVTALQRYPFL